MQYFFTADTHFGHANIIKHCNRPFHNLAHMDKTLIENWNQRVKKDDVVFHLGDFCFRNTTNRGEGEIHKAQYYLNKLNGKIIQIEGNHDRNNTTKTCIQEMRIKLGGKRIILTHRPENIGDVGYDLHFVGHIHTLWKYQTVYYEKKMVNVGVDVWEFKPITIEDILRYLARKKK